MAGPRPTLGHQEDAASHTRSIVMRLGPEIWLSTSIGFELGTFLILRVTYYPTLTALPSKNRNK